MNCIKKHGGARSRIAQVMLVVAPGLAAFLAACSDSAAGHCPACGPDASAGGSGGAGDAGTGGRPVEQGSGGVTGAGGASAGGTASGGSESSGGAGESGGSEGGQESCATPLDATTLRQLVIGPLMANLELKPGQQAALSVGVFECCVAFSPKTTCVTWSLSAGAPATIDSSGLLKIATSGNVRGTFVVVADVEAGRLRLEKRVSVYTPEADPLVGTWRELQQLECGTGMEIAPGDAIQELRFYADGTATVTWHPFEIYVDYRGTYVTDAVGGLTIVSSGGNFVPADFDLTGTYAVKGTRLELHDMWLGTPKDSSAKKQCGHVFARRN